MISFYWRYHNRKRHSRIPSVDCLKSKVPGLWALGSRLRATRRSKLPEPYSDKFQILTLYPILLTKHLKHILSVLWVFDEVPLKDIFNMSMSLFGQVMSKFTERTILKVQLLNLLRKWELHVNKQLNYFRPWDTKLGCVFFLENNFSLDFFRRKFFSAKNTIHNNLEKCLHKILQRNFWKLFQSWISWKKLYFFGKITFVHLSKKSMKLLLLFLYV